MSKWARVLITRGQMTTWIYTRTHTATCINLRGHLATGIIPHRQLATCIVIQVAKIFIFFFNFFQELKYFQNFKF